MNPWHEIEVGEDAPEVVNAIVEIPKGYRAKYELDKDSGLIKLDRVLYSAMYYPANYGFIPKTYCDDKDPLDVLILSQVDIQSLCLVDVKVVGVMQMIDGGEKDDKIIAVAANDLSVQHINDIEDIPLHYRKELKNFFEDYKKLEKKEVEVEELQGKEIALEIVRKAIVDYKVKFGAEVPA